MTTLEARSFMWDMDSDNLKHSGPDSIKCVPIPPCLSLGKNVNTHTPVTSTVTKEGWLGHH